VSTATDCRAFGSCAFRCFIQCVCCSLLQLQLTASGLRGVNGLVRVAVLEVEKELELVTIQHLLTVEQRAWA
jgi:hypothetical protein